MQYAAEIAVAAAAGLRPKAILEECADAISIPNLTSYCPKTLAEGSDCVIFIVRFFSTELL